MIVDEAGAPVGTVEDGDAVVLFNFRADRCVEISKALEYETFSHFDRKRWPKVSAWRETAGVAGGVGLGPRGQRGTAGIGRRRVCVWVCGTKLQGPAAGPRAVLRASAGGGADRRDCWSLAPGVA